MADTGLDWLTAFPGLAGLEPQPRAVLARSVIPVPLPGGAVLFQPGDACQTYLMVLHGTVRVQLLAETGREIVLYRVGAGETCILTTACLMGRTDYSAGGVAETAVSAIALPLPA